MLFVAKLVWGWVMGHSAKQLMWAGAAFGALMLGMWAIHHERAIGRAEKQAEVDTLTANVAKITDANKSCADVLTQVKFSQAQCETGRLADQVATAKAVDAGVAAQKKLAADASAARTKLAALLTGRCKDWANQPACTL